MIAVRKLADRRTLRPVPILLLSLHPYTYLHGLSTNTTNSATRHRNGSAVLGGCRGGSKIGSAHGQVSEPLQTLPPALMPPITVPALFEVTTLSL